MPPDLEIWLFRSFFACSYSLAVQALAHSKCDGVKECVECTCVGMHHKTSIRWWNDALRPTNNSVSLLTHMTANAYRVDQHAYTRKKVTTKLTGCLK